MGDGRREMSRTNPVSQPYLGRRLLFQCNVGTVRKKSSFVRVSVWAFVCAEREPVDDVPRGPGRRLCVREREVSVPEGAEDE
jgi:hypothetical protein